MHNFLTQLQQFAFTDKTPTRPLDLDGWIRADFMPVMIDALRTSPSSDKVVIEVGTWKGLSASVTCGFLKEHFPESKLVCIDTWLGAPEFWTTNGLRDRTRGLSLLPQNGYPTVYETFRSNILRLGYDDLVCPFPISSLEGAKVLRDYGITADVIYIDAAHEYEAVKNDMFAYWDLVKAGGTMMGDDFDPNAWPGVVRAVQEFPMRATIKGQVWSIEKP